MPTELDLPDPLPIRPAGPVDIVVRPPGSKSQTNRSLVCAALAEGTSHLRRPLVSEDSDAMGRCLQALGVRVAQSPDDWEVVGTAGRLPSGPHVLLDAGASGTTARFMTSVAALAPRTVTVDGTARMRERPIGALVAALAGAGVDIRDRDGYPPVTVHGGPLRGGEITIDSSRSSQFLSSLLMASPMAMRPTTIVATGLASAGYVTTTLEVMESFGVHVGVDGHRYHAPSGPYRAATVDIEADASAAVYVWAAAAAAGGTATVQGIPRQSTQPDLGILEVLATMGCEVDGHTVRGSGALRPVELDLSHMPDGAMTVAVLCALAKGTSRLQGLATLRLKETDRIGALITELARVGVEAGMDGDTMVIAGGGDLAGGRIDTYDDHRMAMAFSVLGLAVDGIAISDPGCVTKTWPGFFEALSEW